MSSCPSLEALERSLSRALDPAEQAEVEAHLQTCPRCRETREEIEKNLQAAGSLHDVFRTDPDALTPRSSAHPERLGRYRILQPLGRGGMGQVYLAEDPGLRREVAIKVLPPEVVVDPQRLQAFEAEARLLAAAEHPNIAVIHALESEGERRFLVMERVRGSTLEARMQHGALPLRQLLDVGRQIALALQTAHVRGIVHRDLKPSNVMISDEDRVKVLDFGLARVTHAATPAPSGTAHAPRSRAALSDLVHTRRRNRPSSATGAPGDTGRPSGRGHLITGTPGYMSPEQLRGEAPDPADDVFAFGCLLYEGLTGRPAFPGDSISARTRATLSAQPSEFGFPSGAPAAVRRLVLDCLAPSRSDRPATMEHVRRTIEESIAEGSVRPRSARNAEPPATSSPAASGAGGFHTAVHRPVIRLPRPLSSFVARSSERNAVRAALGRHRLVTISGLGGTGKTRLALELASDAASGFRDGVFFVDLTGVHDRDHATVQILNALETPPGRDPEARFAARVTETNLLLVFDNCESLPDAAAERIRFALEQSLDLRVLATSRQPLGVPGEHVFTLQPMTCLPPGSAATPATLRLSEAERLFIERAQDADPSFRLTPHNAPDIAEICRDTDGIPLVIELCAAKLRVLSVEQLKDRMRALKLAPGPPGDPASRPAAPRDTLRSVLDWTYERLSSEERTLFARLSVFHGGWTLESAEIVCADGDLNPVRDQDVLDLLLSLLDRSLVTPVPGRPAGAPARFRMLETIREYAAETLEHDGDPGRARQRYRDHFRQLVAEAAPYMAGPTESGWLARLDEEVENIRDVLRQFFEHDLLYAAGTLVHDLQRYWHVRGLWSEARAAGTRVLEREDEIAPRDRAGILIGIGALAGSQGEIETARHQIEQGIELARELGDRELIARGEQRLASCAFEVADLAEAQRRYRRALHLQRKAGSRWAVAALLNNLGVVATERKRYRRARRLHEHSLAIRRAIGDRRGTAMSLGNLGSIRYNEGDLDAAEQLFREGLSIHEELHDARDIATQIYSLGRVAHARGDLDLARQRFLDSLYRRREIGDKITEAASLFALAEVEAVAGRTPESLDHFTNAACLYMDVGNQLWLGRALTNCAILAARTSDPNGAAHLLGRARRIREELNDPVPPEQRTPLDEAIVAMKTALGEAAFENALTTGRTMHDEDLRAVFSSGP